MSSIEEKREVNMQVEIHTPWSTWTHTDKYEVRVFKDGTEFTGIKPVHVHKFNTKKGAFNYARRFSRTPLVIASNESMSYKNL